MYGSPLHPANLRTVRAADATAAHALATATIIAVPVPIDATIARASATLPHATTLALPASRLAVAAASAASVECRKGGRQAMAPDATDVARQAAAYTSARESMQVVRKTLIVGR